MASAMLDAQPLTIRTADYTAYSTQPPVTAQATVQPAAAPAAETPLTVLALVGGEAFLAREYWVQGGEMHCVSADGENKIFSLDRVDLYQTANLNRQRNIKFVLQSRDANEP